MPQIRIDGTMILTLAVVGSVLFALSQRKKIAEALNPTSDQNIVFKNAKELVGQETFRDVTDDIFSTITLINPFASEQSKEDARRLRRVNSGDL